MTQNLDKTDFSNEIKVFFYQRTQINFCVSYLEGLFLQFHLLPVFADCRRQRGCNLPIAGGKGNYRQNAMYNIYLGSQIKFKLIGLPSKAMLLIIFWRKKTANIRANLSNGYICANYTWRFAGSFLCRRQSAI